jgi:hypothetical protein
VSLGLIVTDAIQVFLRRPGAIVTAAKAMVVVTFR